MSNIFTDLKKLQNDLDHNPAVISYNYQLVDRLDSLISDNGLKKIVLQLYLEGHYAQAVENAYKYVNNLVKAKSEADSSFDGSKLMEYAFSAGKPILRLNSGKTKSEQDEQLGYMKIFSGVMSGIRNPRAHEFNWNDSQENAFQLIIFADHLVKKIEQSIVQKAN